MRAFDAGVQGNHNHEKVRSSFGRVVFSLVLAPYIALSAVAPEHVHEADADHPRPAAHRHLQPHSVDSHDDDHTQLAGDDEHVVWVDAGVLHQSTYQLVAPVVPPAARFELVPPAEEWALPPDYDSAPPHGPPRASLSSRAPPSPFV